MVTVSFYWIAETVLTPYFKNLSKIYILLIIGFSIFTSVLLIFFSTINLNRYYSFLFPYHTLEIFPVDKGQVSVQLVSFDSELGSFPSGKIKLPYAWKGKPGSWAILSFSPETGSNQIEIVWDGVKQIRSISSSKTKTQVNIKQYFELPIFHKIIYSTSIFLCLSYLVTCLTVFFLVLNKQNKQFVWLAFPMILTWLIYLLTFWPGLSSYDTVFQWDEAHTGLFTDAHPAIHTMFISLVSNTYPSIAAIALTQIISLAFVSAWGLSKLKNRGLSTFFVWVLAFCFAFLPVNSLMVITIWKDIPYGCAVFVLFIQFFEIVFSKGSWIEKRENQGGLIISSLAVSLLRHNGIPVALTGVAILLIYYKKHWGILFRVILIVLGVYFFVREPFYAFMKVKSYPGFLNILMFDHIGAHIKAGTPIESENRIFLNNLIPFEKWPYICQQSDIRNMDGPIPFDYFSKPDPRPANIAIKLFLLNPSVDFQHTLCAARLIYMIDPGYPIYSVPLVGYHYGASGVNGIKPESKFPGLLNKLPTPSSKNPVLWRPAFYLYIIIASLFILLYRGKSKIISLIYLPIFIQTCVMVVVNYAPDFRYMFSTELIALFSIGMILLPSSELKKSGKMVVLERRDYK